MPLKLTVAYQMRNSVEEAFAVMKQDTGGRRFGTSTDSTTEGKIFTVFIAASIGLMFKTRISQCKTKGMQIPFEGDRAIMTKLCGIKATLWEDDMHYTEVTGKKRELRDALDIPLPDTAVFTKAELESMREDASADEDVSFIAKRRRACSNAVGGVSCSSIHEHRQLMIRFENYFAGMKKPQTFTAGLSVNSNLGIQK